MKTLILGVLGALLAFAFSALAVNQPPRDPVVMKYNEHQFMKHRYGKAISGGATLGAVCMRLTSAILNAPLQLLGYGGAQLRAAKASTLELKREAGAKREEARTRFEALTSKIQAQKSGVPEGESKMTATEIANENQAIQDLLAESKALEGLDTIEGLMTHAGGDTKARETLNDGARGGGTPDTPAHGFKNVGAFLRAIRAVGDDSYNGDPVTADQRKHMNALYKAGTAYQQGEVINEKKLIQSALAEKTLVGDNTGSAGRGDYLVPTEHMAELLRAMGEQQQFASRARRIPMSRRTIDFPRLKQDDGANVTRPIFSFAAVAKIAEGAQKPEREPKFEQLTLTAVKYAAYLEASDELLTDSIVEMPPVLVELLTSSIAYEFDRDTMRGSGSGEPQGFLGHASEWVQNRTTANQVNTGDVFGMESRFFGNEGIYLHHPSVLPQLYGLTKDNIVVWHPNLADGAPGTLLGRPLVRTHKLPTLGTKGDICLVDPKFYLVGDLQRITIANSIHYQFRNDVTAWRAVFRAAGTPWPAGLFSYEASGGAETYRVSPFCVLGAVASS